MPCETGNCRLTARPLLLLALASLLLALVACSSIEPNAAEQRNKPYLVLVSFDGFRWDYASLTDTPSMDRMARTGLKAEALQPAFPTVTFPNHFSIASGTLPWRHGIVANDFPNDDRTDWYRYKEIKEATSTPLAVGELRGEPRIVSGGRDGRLCVWRPDCSLEWELELLSSIWKAEIAPGSRLCVSAEAGFLVLDFEA